MSAMERRYLLDTNIVIYFLTNPKELERFVWNILTDYNNLFYISAVSVMEIVHLYNIGKLRTKWKSAEDIFPAMEEVYFQILPLTAEHNKVHARLSEVAGHKDPNDHAIIAQAIAEKMTLISSDRMFERYVPQKLRFIFNDR